MERSGGPSEPLFIVNDIVSTSVDGLTARQAKLRSFGGSDPAANTEIAETVPAGVSWKLLTVTVQNVQGGTGTPQPILVLDDGTNVLFESFGATAAQAISTTCRYTWGIGLPLTGLVGATTNVHATAPLPANLVLAAGSRITTNSPGKDANTNFGAPRLYVVEYS